MKRFIEATERSQAVLFPERLDDYIDEDNPVRVVDAFVDALDLTALGFEAAGREAGGRPAYHPSVLLKIYIYGYLNRVPSSRRLEREAQRNLELIWLTGRLAPDFKTIADFRRDNGPAIRKACSQFIALCRQLKLFSHAVVAIDGSKFKAVNSRDRNFSANKVAARLTQLEETAGRYLSELDRADRDPAVMPEGRVEHLQAKLAKVRSEMQRMAEMARQVEAAPDRQVSQTDPDARSMATSGNGRGIVGYNVQVAVDAEHHLILAHEVTNDGHDRTQLSSMATQARSALGAERLTALADRGYYNGPEILKCENAGILPLVPKPLTSGALASGRFDKRDFHYLPEQDIYRCPAGQEAIRRFTTEERGLTRIVYWSSSCPSCPIKATCTPSQYRRIARWEHEDVLDRMQARLDAHPEAGIVRRQTVEHVFGTLKAWLGTTPLLTKTLPKVATEIGLAVLAYNIKRVIRMIGTKRLVEAIYA